jgi:hypothetical protein
MIDHVKTVRTQSVQLWVNRDTHGLGWMHGQVSFSAFVHPFDTWADLSHLIEAEAPGPAGQDPARGVHYFCSTLPELQIPKTLRAAANPDRLRLDDPQHVASVRNIAAVQTVVRENARYFLDEWIYQLWPDATYRYPTAFRWTLLVDAKNRSGPDRLEGQHVVANVDPSERYRSACRTTRYRLPPDEEVVRRNGGD